MNGVDLIFLVLLIGGLVLGFFQGTIRLLIAIVAMYVAIILASLYFQVAGNWIRSRMQTSQYVGGIVAFTMIFLVSFLLLTLAGLYTFRYARIPAGLEFIDRIIGTLLGLMLSGLFLGMFALVLDNLFIAQSTATAVSFPIAQWFQQGARRSLLLPFFGSTILPYIYASLRPILPPESAIIFHV